MFAELAAAAGSVLAGAVATDAWGWVKDAIKKVFQRGGTSETAVDKWLEGTIGEVSGDSDHDAALARIEQRWTARIEDLLDGNPDLAADLQALVERARTELPAAISQGHVVQHADARDHAQQVVQGHGTQDITFNAPK
jgi:hypothetical protein